MVLNWEALQQKMQQIMKQIEVREQLEVQQKHWQHQLKIVSIDIARYEQQLHDSQQQIKELQQDSFFQKLIGKLLGYQQQVEKQQYIIKYRQEKLAQELQARANIQQQLDELALQQHFGDKQSLEQQLQEVREEMLEWLYEYAPKMAKQYTIQMEQLADIENTYTKLQQLIEQGRSAVYALRELIKELQDADYLAILDILVLGSKKLTINKHQQLDLVNRHLRHAENELDRFWENAIEFEMKKPQTMELDIGRQTAFVDQLFDNVITSWKIQKRIEDVEQMVVNEVTQVERLLNNLQHKLAQLESERSRLQKETEQIFLKPVQALFLQG